LTLKDGSLWLLDASDGEANGPRAPFKPVQFRKVRMEKPVAAYAGGATHAAGAGIHGPIGVVLTPDGEVWTWGMILGDPPTVRDKTIALAAKVATIFHLKVPPPDPDPIYRQQPWQLRNIPESQ
jgi:hypothetical protein